MKEAHAGHHITPISTFVKTLFALTFFMILTIMVYKFNLGAMIAGHGSKGESYINNAVALSIAVVKATIVVMFFMGVKYGTNLIKLYAMAGFVWVTLMGIIFGDYLTRGWEPIQGWTPGEKPNGWAVLPSDVKVKTDLDKEKEAEHAREEAEAKAEH